MRGEESTTDGEELLTLRTLGGSGAIDVASESAADRVTFDDLAPFARTAVLGFELPESSDSSSTVVALRRLE